MSSIDEFQTIRAAEHRGADRLGHARLADDKSGKTLADRIDRGRPPAGRTRHRHRRQRRDPRSGQAWIADPGIDVVITTGGTGFTGRDVTPEALEPLFEKRMDGFSTRSTSATTRSAPRRSRAGRPAASPAPPSSSACRARPAPAATPGTASSAHQLDYRTALQFRRDHAAPGRASAAA